MLKSRILVGKLLLNYINMSKIGKLPVLLNPGVNAKIDHKSVVVTGPKGSLTLILPGQIKVEQVENNLIVTRLSEAKMTRAAHGATRAHLANMVNGVVTPFVKNMEIRGTGYKFQLSGNKLTVLAGYIHPVYVDCPAGVVFQCPDESKLIISGPDIEAVGQIASTIRKIRPPEVYKGKGIRYTNEVIKLKPGKTAKTGA